MQTSQELHQRFAALGYQLDSAFFRVTVDDLVQLLAARLTEKGLQSERLTQEDLEGIINQVADVLNGEGMTTIWRMLFNLAIRDGWPERLDHEEKT